MTPPEPATFPGAGMTGAFADLGPASGLGLGSRRAGAVTSRDDHRHRQNSQRPRPSDRLS